MTETTAETMADRAAESGVAAEHSLAAGSGSEAGPEVGVVTAPGSEAGTAADLGTEAGMATAEYAIGTLGAAGIAGLLVVLLKGGGVKDMLMSLIQQALSVG